MNTDTGCLFAVKTIDFPSGSKLRATDLEDLAVEVERWRTFSHPHIINVFGCEYSACHLNMHLEYVPEGSLCCFLQSFGALGEPLLKQASRGSVAGLEYLHTRDPAVAHGNLKGSNVIIDEGFCVKLTDFGYPQLNVGRPLHAYTSSLPWMAPEVVQAQVMDGTKADIWSMGCLFIEMATAERPWGDAASLDAVFLALRSCQGVRKMPLPPIPAALSADARDFVGACLQQPGGRPSAGELLRRSFLAGGGSGSV